MHHGHMHHGHISVGYPAWSPEGQSQAGPKGRKLEVRPRRGPRLLVSIYLLYWHWSGVFRLWANEAFHRILIGDGRPWARNEHQWHFGEKCNYKFLNTTNRPRFCTKLIQSNLVIKQSRSNLVEMLDKSETVCSLSFDCPTDIFLYYFARSLLSDEWLSAVSSGNEYLADTMQDFFTDLLVFVGAFDIYCAFFVGPWLVFLWNQFQYNCSLLVPH